MTGGGGSIDENGEVEYFDAFEWAHLNGVCVLYAAGAPSLRWLNVYCSANEVFQCDGAKGEIFTTPNSQIDTLAFN